MGCDFRRHHPAERLSDRDRSAGQCKLADCFLVDQHQVPEVVDLINGVSVALAGPGVLGGVNRVALGQRVEERIKMETRRWMKIEQRRSRTRRLEAKLEFASPYLDSALANIDVWCAHRRTSAGTASFIPAATGLPPKRAGHQWWSHV